MSLAKKDTPAPITYGRVFIPSSSRMISMHTGSLAAFTLLGIFLNFSTAILRGKPFEIIKAIKLLLIMDISGLFFFTLLYDINRDLFSIKIDDVSVTGPHRFCAKHILRNEIDPARSMHRNLIDRFVRHWHICDAEGNGIAISGLDFRADEIAEILRTIGLEMA